MYRTYIFEAYSYLETFLGFSDTNQTKTYSNVSSYTSKISVIFNLVGFRHFFNSVL